MIKQNLYDPFSIQHQTLDVYPKLEHKHNFFELVYIVEGTGEQCINQSKFKYKPGHLFLLTPDDCHTFNIETTTRFFFLQFNYIYLKNGALHNESIRRLEYILHNANHQPGCILKNIIDKQLVAPMVDAMIREVENKDLYNQELVQQLVNTLIIVVARNIAKYLPEQVNPGTEERATDILQYIQNNIYYPEKLKVEAISNNFGISEAYLGKYFKRHTSETLQQYVTNYKTKLIEHRLQFSDKRLNEIASEFGFTDESHFNKFFKKQRVKSPKEFRRLVRG